MSLVNRSQEVLKLLLKALTPAAEVPSTPAALLDAFETEDDPVDEFSEKKTKMAFVSLLTLLMAHAPVSNSTLAGKVSILIIPMTASSELFTSATLVQFSFPNGFPFCPELFPGFLPLEAIPDAGGRFPPVGG